jgi:hypothetical protein
LSADAVIRDMECGGAAIAVAGFAPSANLAVSDDAFQDQSFLLGRADTYI